MSSGLNILDELTAQREEQARLEAQAARETGGSEAPRDTLDPPFPFVAIPFPVDILEIE